MRNVPLDYFDPKAPQPAGEQKAVKPLGSPMDDLPRIEKPASLPAAPNKARGVVQPDRENLEIKISRHQEINISRFQDYKTTAFSELLAAVLSVKPAEMISFNYPSGLLQKLDETLFRLKMLTSRRRKRATKTAVLITSLTYLLWEYEQHGKESILYTSLVK